MLCLLLLAFCNIKTKVTNISSSSSSSISIKVYCSEYVNLEKIIIKKQEKLLQNIN